MSARRLRGGVVLGDSLTWPSALQVTGPWPPGCAMGDLRGRRRLLLLIVAAVVAVDQISKAIAVHELAGRGIVPIFGGALHVTLYRNFAGSANRLTGHPVLVSLLALAAVLLIGAASLRARGRGRATTVAAGLLLGGGVSNLLDRLLRAPGPLRGGVVDWIKPTLSGATMNLADVAITAGVVVLVISALVGGWRARTEDALPRPA